MWTGLANVPLKLQHFFTDTFSDTGPCSLEIHPKSLCDCVIVNDILIGQCNSKWYLKYQIISTSHNEDFANSFNTLFIKEAPFYWKFWRWGTILLSIWQKRPHFTTYSIKLRGTKEEQEWASIGHLEIFSMSSCERQSAREVQEVLEKQNRSTWEEQQGYKRCSTEEHKMNNGGTTEALHRTEIT